MSLPFGRPAASICYRLIVGAYLLASATVAQGAPADDLRESAVRLQSQYTKALEALADGCETQGLAEQAKATRDWIRPNDPQRLYFTALPVDIGPPELPAETPEPVRRWHEQFWNLRRTFADEAYLLARKANRERQTSLALDLVWAAIRENPDHEGLRRLLGYQPFRGQWGTDYEADKLRDGYVWHDKFGWLRKSYVQRYEDGQRLYRGRWISAEQDARLHQDIRNGWHIETEHYLIVTNHSIEAGVALGEKLELLYRIWQRLFLSYYASEAELRAMFDGRNPGGRISVAHHRVVLFRDREDFIRTLQNVMPGIEVAIGSYLSDTRTAYFFVGRDHDERTLFHEATHQLFHESRRVADNVGRDANFWIVEAVALYMESLKRRDSWYTVGGFDDIRMNAARVRLLKDNWYIPLAELTTYGMEKIQKHPEIRTVYSQLAGLGQFLIHYDGGRYRDALVAYLDAVYSGRDTPDTLARITRTSYPELDRQYREFLTRGE